MIVVGVDGSPEATAALEWAADDALRMHHARCPVAVMRGR
ncbi:universal stress protein [Nonomuraea sediminis]|nr:universal stress protein [Nonomuraea sediminis]